MSEKKKRSAHKLFSRYKTYEGEPGSPEQWASQGQALLVSFSAPNALSLLGLSQVPTTVDELKAARRRVMMAAHPDLGGDAAEAVRINEAYLAMERLMSLAQRPARSAKEPVGLVVPPRCTAALPSNLDDPQWAYELKVDGERFVFYIGFDPYGRNLLPNTLLSRHKSTGDGCYVDRSGNAQHLTNRSYPGLDKTVLDTEIFLRSLVVTQSIMGSSEVEASDKQRQIGNVDCLVFDISFYRGEDVRQKPYEERRVLLLSVVAAMSNPHVKAMPRYSEGNAQELFDRLTSAGEEGLIAKRKDGSYGQHWAKMKKACSVSCVITGYRPGQKALAGMVGSLALSVYKDGVLTEVGFASGMTNKQREDMTANFSSYLGRVVDVFCMELTADGRLRSPTYHCMRQDVNADECSMAKLQDDLTKVFSSRSKGKG